jgi:NAD(P)-dependent dehydrogenase (short-subunit alcohol dehydrogenase family)
VLNVGRFQYVKCDVLSWQDQVELFKTAIAWSPKGGIDIVVASAGVSGPDGFHDLGLLIPCLSH